MSHLAKDMTPDVTWKDITPGCNIYEGGTSSVVETGDWRTMKPVIDWDKCRQCLLCAPVCPDMSIPVNGEGKREDFDYFFCKGCGSGWCGKRSCLKTVFCCPKTESPRTASTRTHISASSAQSLAFWDWWFSCLACFRPSMIGATRRFSSSR